MADGVNDFKDFFVKTQSVRAQFHQIVTDSKGKKIQEVDGTMQLQRPGKFRWDYKKPYVQEIVSDGKKIWLYDADLNQITVRSLDSALGASPAALLAGDKEIDKNFTVKELSRKNSTLAWIIATPKEKDSGFDKVVLGFSGKNLQTMELLDSFGHTTTIVFSSIVQNPKLETSQFQLSPKAGADLVGE
jgi:outer membrane lipoprotein carrier protein